MTIDYSTLGAGTHTFTVIATDSDTDSISDEFVLEVLNYSSQLNNRTLSANATLTGTTLDDAIIGNTFSATELDNVYLDGGDGNDTISVNILTASFHMWHVTFDGGAGDDTINSNTLITSDNDFSIITFDGGAGDDTISGNTLNSSSEILSITFDGGDGNDIVSNNTLTASGNIWRITFDGGAGNDTFTGNSLTAGFAASIIIFDGGAGDDNISGNTLAADATVYSITFYGRAGEDTISGNTLYEANNVTLHGGDGNDTISGNTLTSSVSISAIVFNGGDGNDTISDNHFEATGIYRNVNSILLGGKGDDVFRNNSATQSHGVLATLTIDGGDGEDTVVFRSIADEYAGIFDWTHGVTTITLTGDGAAVILIDIETVAFADGASYSTSDAWVKGNGGILYDLANTFASTFSDHSTDSGTITGNTLTLASTELAHGANTIVITATAINNAETTETITINAVKTLKSTGAKQHDQQTLDLNAIFVDAHTYTSTQTNGASGISLNNNILSFDNTVLDEGTQFVTITASDGSDAFTHTLTYALDTIKDQTFSDGGSNSSYIGTTYADEITDNSFAETSGSLSNIYLDGGAGEDTISSNTLTASAAVWEITFDGRDGDDTISDNHFMSSGMDSSISTHYSGVHAVVLLGSAGNDTISSNTISANHDIWSSTFDGGDGDDTISGNTIITDWSVASITLHGGDGNDTISDNHFEATGTSTSSNVFSITFMGGAGDDVFRDNFATQANEESARLTIDGGAGEDTVVFRLIADEYAGISDWIDGGGMTTITLTGDGAAVTLIDVETIAFADGASYSAADAWVKGNGGILYDLAKAFAGTFTGYTTSSGTIGTGTGQGNTLTLAGTELAHGANTIVVTATDAETTETITVNAVKTLRIAGAKQHDQQMIDLNAIFVDAHTYTYTSAQTSGGISLNNSTLSFANTVLSEGAQAIT
nr:calcium-binding protein [Actinomycetes bacterium]